jgi:hypothetical protein
MVALTVAAADRVRGLVSLDIADDVEQPDGSVVRQSRTVPFDIIDAGSITRTLEVLRSNYGKIGEVLYATCRQQVEDKKLTREQFLDGLRGDALEAGLKALEAELVDFFPKGLRSMVGLLVAKMDEVSAELMAKAEAGLKEVTVETVAPSGTRSTKRRGSSASTQANGPSEDSLSQETAA